EMTRLVHDGVVQSIAFSLDGRFLATGSADNTARLMETAHGTEVARVLHGGAVYGVALSPDGRFLATGSGDNTARLFAIPSGREMARVVHGGAVSRVLLSPDGRFLATGSVDKMARLVWADPQYLFDLLCTKAGRNLRQGEWASFLGPGEPWRPTCTSWR